MQYKPGNWVTGFKRSPRAANVQNRDMGLFLNSTGKFEPIDDSWDNLHSGGLFISDDNKLYFRDETNKDIYINSPAAETLGLSAGNATTAGFVTINEEGFDTDFRVEASGEANALFVQGSSSYVGIGTNDPDSKLHISTASNDDDIKIQRSANNRTGVIKWVTGTTSDWFMGQWNTSDSDFYLYNYGTSSAALTVLRTSGNVGIGAAPGTVREGQKLEVITSADYGGAVLSTWSTAALESPLLDFNRSKSATIGTHTAVADNDNLGWIVFRASAGVEFLNAAYIAGQVDGAVTGGGTNDMPGRLVFATTPDGSNIATERMRIDSAGNVGIGTNNPGEKLHVNTTSGAHSYIKAEIGATATYQSALELKTGNTDWIIGNTAGADNLWFYSVTNTAQRMKIDGPTGDVTVDAGNLIIGTAGKGIDFSAQSSPAAGMTAELLDRYETGTWTGVISDGTNNATMGANTGTYTRIGNMVTVSAQIITSSLGSVSGSIRLTGLPFTVANNDRNYATLSAGGGYGLNITGGLVPTLNCYKNTTHATISLWDLTTGTSGMQGSEWSDDGQLTVSGSYMVS